MKLLHLPKEYRKPIAFKSKNPYKFEIYVNLSYFAILFQGQCSVCERSVPYSSDEHDHGDCEEQV